MTALGAGGLAHWDDVPAQLVDRYGKRATWQNLGSTAGSVGVGVKRLRIEHGCSPTPPHVHPAEEEIFFVLDGGGLSWQDGETFEVRAGDCLVHRPAEEAHTLRGGEGGLDVLAFGQRIWTEAGQVVRGDVAWLGMSWVRTGGEHPWALDEAAGELEFREPSPRPPRIVNVGDVEPRRIVRGDSVFAERDLARAANSEQTGLCHVEIEPGRIGYPPHCHGAEEELFVVLGGEGVLLLYPRGGGDPAEHELRPGSIVARPAGTGVAHAFRAAGHGLTLLAYGTREPNDSAYYPRSGKVYLRGLGIVGRFERLDYWDGEE